MNVVTVVTVNGVIMLTEVVQTDVTWVCLVIIVIKVQNQRKELKTFQDVYKIKLELKVRDLISYNMILLCRGITVKKTKWVIACIE